MCVCVYVYMYVHLLLSACLPACLSVCLSAPCTYVRVCMYVRRYGMCVYARTHARTHAHMHACMHACMPACMCSPVQVLMCVSLCICVCVCARIYAVVRTDTCRMIPSEAFKSAIPLLRNRTATRLKILPTSREPRELVQHQPRYGSSVFVAAAVNEFDDSRRPMAVALFLVVASAPCQGASPWCLAV